MVLLCLLLDAVPCGLCYYLLLFCFGLLDVVDVAFWGAMVCLRWFAVVISRWVLAWIDDLTCYYCFSWLLTSDDWYCYNFVGKRFR